MKKITITLLSIFVLINIAFAQQTTQQKIDSLQNEKAKADQALAQANENFKANQSSQNYDAAKNAKAKQDKVSAELSAALDQQRKEAEAAKEKAEQEKFIKETNEKIQREALESAKKKTEDAQYQQARQKVFDKYPEYLGTALEPVLIEKFKADPNFVIKDIYYDYKNNIFVNKKKVLGGNGPVQMRIYLWNNDPTLMVDYRRLLRANHGISEKIRAAIKEKIGKDYTYSGFYDYNYNNLTRVHKSFEDTPLKCKHTISYVELEDFMQYIPRCDFYNGEIPKNKIMLHMCNYLPSKLVMVDGKFSSHYIDNVVKRLHQTSTYAYHLKTEIYAFEGCTFQIEDIDKNMWNPEGKPWENKIHKVQSFVFPAEYKCEETLAQVAKYGIK